MSNLEKIEAVRTAAIEALTKSVNEEFLAMIKAAYKAGVKDTCETIENSGYVNVDLEVNEDVYSNGLNVRINGDISVELTPSDIMDLGEVERETLYSDGLEKFLKENISAYTKNEITK